MTKARQQFPPDSLFAELNEPVESRPVLRDYLIKEFVKHATDEEIIDLFTNGEGMEVINEPDDFVKGALRFFGQYPDEEVSE